MDKKSFKIGDNVRLINPHEWTNIGGVGTIISFDRYIQVTWEEGLLRGDSFPHIACEIEAVLRKGQQLLFGFMKPQA